MQEPHPIDALTRRAWLQRGAATLLGAGAVTSSHALRSEETASPPEPIRPGAARVWRPKIDLEFTEPGGIAQWWVPELVLLGNTDVMLSARGPAPWKRDGENWSYEKKTMDGQLYVAVKVERVKLGWRASMTLGNRSAKTWNDVVSPVCLQLRGSPAFADADWTRTYYRSGGELLTYREAETGGGRNIYRMSLVKDQKQIKRTPRHQRKWGFTKRQSDDGIFAVIDKNRTTVLTTHWQPTHHLQANLKRSFACIHANPFFGRLQPGESRTRHGCVLLVPGSLERAWEATRALMKTS